MIIAYVVILYEIITLFKYIYFLVVARTQVDKKKIMGSVGIQSGIRDPHRNVSVIAPILYRLSQSDPFNSKLVKRVIF